MSSYWTQSLKWPMGLWSLMAYPFWAQTIHFWNERLGVAKGWEIWRENLQLLIRMGLVLMSAPQSLARRRPRRWSSPGHHRHSPTISSNRAAQPCLMSVTTWILVNHSCLHWALCRHKHRILCQVSGGQAHQASNRQFCGQDALWQSPTPLHRLLIKQAVLHVSILGDHVSGVKQWKVEGHYYITPCSNNCITYIYVGWHIAHEWEEKSFPCLQESRRLAITRGRMTKWPWHTIINTMAGPVQ